MVGLASVTGSVDNPMSLTESDMSALRELFVDVAGAMGKSIQDQLGVQIAASEKSLRGELTAFEKSVNGRFDALTDRVDGLTAEVGAVKAQVGQVLDRLTVIEADVNHMRAQLAGLARVDVQRRLEKLEARLDALEAQS